MNIVAPQTPLTTKQRLKSILGGSVGNLVEWYDWYVYSAFSLYFAKSFFPGENRTAQLLNTSGVFAIGFLMRPIGGWVMGLYADRRGRKAALTLSVLMMCFGSLLIAISPTYGQVGLLAPIILVCARLLQGLSVGGEYGTSATYLSEIATSKSRGFYSSFQYVTLIMGQLLALSVLLILQQFLLTASQLQEWGWRIPFAIGALFSLVAIYLRREISETESFELHKTENQKNKKRSSLRKLLQHPKAVLTVMGLTLGGTLAFYTFSTYMQKFLVNTIGLSDRESTLVSAATLFIFMLLQPVIGALSDRIGRKPILITFGILGAAFTVPLLTLLSQTKSTTAAFLLIMLGLIIVSGYTAINAVVKAELFPAEIRALGVGLPYAITVSIFGGTAEYLALWLKHIGHEHYFYWYVASSIALSLLIYITMPDTKKVSEIDRD
jgi:MHS family alpha-ketoglutarate permease-like MFS transporter